MDAQSTKIKATIMSEFSRIEIVAIKLFAFFVTQPTEYGVQLESHKINTHTRTQE